MLATDEAGGAGGVGNGVAEASEDGVVTLLLATLLSAGAAGALLAVEDGAALIGTGTEPCAVALSAARFNSAVCVDSSAFILASSTLDLCALAVFTGLTSAGSALAVALAAGTALVSEAGAVGAVP